MRIRYARPIKTKKQFLCKGDEATVRRVLSGKYKGLAERTQEELDRELDPALARHFLIADDWRRGGPYSPQTIPQIMPSYHLLKFLANALAHSLFPENFARQHEFRAFRDYNLTIYASYSDFVPDETQSIGRKTEARSRYYQALRGEIPQKPESLRQELDEQERAMVPSLLPTIKKIRKAGIVLDHPEVNYHLHQDSIVFFDVDGIVLEPLVRLVSSDTNASSILGAMTAAMVRVLPGEHDPTDFFNETFDSLQKLFSLYFHSYAYAHLYQDSVDRYRREGWKSKLRKEGLEYYRSLWEASVKRDKLPPGIGNAVEMNEKAEAFLTFERRMQ